MTTIRKRRTSYLWGVHGRRRPTRDEQKPMETILSSIGHAIEEGATAAAKEKAVCLADAESDDPDTADTNEELQEKKASSSSSSSSSSSCWSIQSSDGLKNEVKETTRLADSDLASSDDDDTNIDNEEESQKKTAPSSSSSWWSIQSSSEQNNIEDVEEKLIKGVDSFVDDYHTMKTITEKKRTIRRSTTSHAASDDDDNNNNNKDDNDDDNGGKTMKVIATKKETIRMRRSTISNKKGQQRRRGPKVIKVTEEENDDDEVAAATKRSTKYVYKVEYEEDNNDEDDDAEQRVGGSNTAVEQMKIMMQGKQQQQQQTTNKILYCNEDELRTRFPPIWLNLKEHKKKRSGNTTMTGKKKKKKKRDTATTFTTTATNTSKSYSSNSSSQDGDNDGNDDNSSDDVDNTTKNSSSWKYVYPNNLVGGGIRDDNDDDTDDDDDGDKDNDHTDDDNNTDDDSYCEPGAGAGAGNLINTTGSNKPAVRLDSSITIDSGEVNSDQSEEGGGGQGLEDSGVGDRSWWTIPKKKSEEKEKVDDALEGVFSPVPHQFTPSRKHKKKVQLKPEVGDTIWNINNNNNKDEGIDDSEHSVVVFPPAPDGVQRGSVLSPWASSKNKTEEDEKKNNRDTPNSTDGGSHYDDNDDRVCSSLINDDGYRPWVIPPWNNNNTHNKTCNTTSNGKYVYPHLLDDHNIDNGGDGGDTGGNQVSISCSSSSTGKNNTTIIDRSIDHDDNEVDDQGLVSLTNLVNSITINNNNNNDVPTKPYYVYPDFIYTKEGTNTNDDDDDDAQWCISVHDRVQRGSASPWMTTMNKEDKNAEFPSAVHDAHTTNHSIIDGVQRGWVSPWTMKDEEGKELDSCSFLDNDNYGIDDGIQRGSVSPWNISEVNKFKSYADYIRYPYPKTLYHKNNDGRISIVTNKGSVVGDVDFDEEKEINDDGGVSVIKKKQRPVIKRSQSVRRFKDILSAKEGLKSVLRRTHSDNNLDCSSKDVSRIIDPNNRGGAFDVGKTLGSYFAIAQLRLKKWDRDEDDSDYGDHDIDAFSKNYVSDRRYSASPYAHLRQSLRRPALRRTRSDPELDQHQGGSSNRVASSMLNHNDGGDSNYEAAFSILTLAKAKLRPIVRRSNSDPKMSYDNDVWKTLGKHKIDFKQEVAWEKSKIKLRPVHQRWSKTSQQLPESMHLRGGKQAVKDNTKDSFLTFVDGTSVMDNGNCKSMGEKCGSRTKGRKGSNSTRGIRPTSVSSENDKGFSLPTELKRVRGKLTPVRRKSSLLLSKMVKMKTSTKMDDGGDFLHSMKQNLTSKDVGAVLDTLRQSLMLDDDDDDNDDDGDKTKINVPSEWAKVRGTLNRIHHK